jgi:hypothetical protein
MGINMINEVMQSAQRRDLSYRAYGGMHRSALYGGIGGMSGVGGGMGSMGTMGVQRTYNVAKFVDCEYASLVASLVCSARTVSDCVCVCVCVCVCRCAVMCIGG